MKISNLLKGLLIALLLLPAPGAGAQKKASFDLAYIRNTRYHVNGLNLSAFYHFSERLVGGIEMNRFFPANRIDEERWLQSSSWDFDMNVHYLFLSNKILKVYPLMGVSHTSEKEFDLTAEETVYDRFWSFNAGAGVLASLGKWLPHVEYVFSWGHENQQFLLAGISYEIGWGKKEK